MDSNFITNTIDDDSNYSCNNEVLYFSTNQDQNCIAVGTKTGFKIFSSDQFQLFYESKCGPISIVEMFYTTNLIFLVGLTEFGEFSPKKVIIWSTSTNAILCSTWQFNSKINIVKISKKRMIVCENVYMHVYNAKDMKILHTLDCGTIFLGKLVLSPNSDKNNLVCFSSNKDEGVVKVYDLAFVNFRASFMAHKSPLLKMNINYNGDMLLTSSCKGTTINVFSLPNGDKITSYKRGINSAYIFWLGFSLSQDKIIISSDTGTINIFDLAKDKEMGFENADTKSNAIVDFFGKLTSNVTALFCSSKYDDYYTSSKNSMFCKCDYIQSSNIIAFNPNNNKEAFCFNSDGSFYLFSVNYDTKAIKKTYECNMSDLKLIA